jgi:NAD(P)-dependent dehydrogenase (short-subunit alcohol dehydrogenase family)
MSAPKPRMEGKVAIVTGAGSSGPGIGTGRAMSVLFAREGAKVILMDSNKAAAEETLQMIRKEGSEASLFVGNITSEASCCDAVAAASTRYGKLDTLVNNVAVTVGGPANEMKEDDIDRLLSVNLKGPMLMTKAAAPAIEKAGGGSITNISSISALRWTPNQSIYTASKGGVVSLTTAWAVEFGRRKIRVNCICPGTLYTPIAVGLFRMPEAVRWNRTFLPPLGEEGNAWDIAYAALFLASDEARWITGVTIPVDGGMVAATPQWGADVYAARRPDGSDGLA